MKSMKRLPQFKKLGVLFLFFVCINATSIFAQSTSVSYDARMLNDYTVGQLDEIKTQDPDLYIALEYYYTQSYVIEVIDCEECSPIDPATFNIGQWEYLRKREDYRVFVNPKRGFRLTLTPISKLEYKLPAQLARLEYNFGQ
jgi:hypothetical protein